MILFYSFSSFFLLARDHKLKSNVPLFLPCFYILYSEKFNKYYVDAFIDLERSTNEHNIGHSKFIKPGISWSLMYTEVFETLIEAKRRKLVSKKMKSRKYNAELIAKSKAIAILIGGVGQILIFINWRTDFTLPIIFEKVVSLCWISNFILIVSLIKIYYYEKDPVCFLYRLALHFHSL